MTERDHMRCFDDHDQIRIVLSHAPEANCQRSVCGGPDAAQVRTPHRRQRSASAKRLPSRSLARSSKATAIDNSCCAGHRRQRPWHGLVERHGSHSLADQPNSLLGHDSGLLRSMSDGPVDPWNHKLSGGKLRFKPSTLIFLKRTARGRIGCIDALVGSLAVGFAARGPLVCCFMEEAAFCLPIVSVGFMAAPDCC